MFWRIRLLGLAAALLAAHAGSAAAQSIAVTPGSTCLSKGQVEGMVSMFLDGRELDPALQGMVFEVVGSEEVPSAVEVRMHQQGRAVVRRFEPVPEDCAALHAAVGLVIALALDPAALPTFEPAPAPAPAPAPDAPTAGNPLRWSVLAQWDIATLSTSAFGLALGAQLLVGPWAALRVQVAARYGPGLRLGERGRVALTLIAADARLCAGGALAESAHLLLCAGPAVGALHARGYDFSQDFGRTAAWIGALAGVRLQLHLGLDWLVDADLVTPMLAPVLEAQNVDGTRSEQRLRDVGLLLSLGVALP